MKYQHIFESVVKASRELLTIPSGKIDEILLALAEEAKKQTFFLLDENKKDLELIDANDPKYDRLRLTADRLKGIAADIRKVSALPSPVEKVLEKRDLDNGLHLEKVSVPLGVIGIIYEARPNVTFDVFSLCLKSKNACLLKGGSDAKFSNAAIISVIKKVLNDFEVNPSTGELLPPDREATQEMLTARGYVDVLIPRGSQSLINYVADNAKIPVIETGAGIVHTYLDENADLEKAPAIIHNAKTRRCSVCNALDCLIVHRAQLSQLPDVLAPLGESEVVLYADQPSFKALQEKYPLNLLFPATEESFGTEYLSMRMAIKTVNNFDEALSHIQQYSSKHSEAIISTDAGNIERFLNEVDAAAVYANTSTAFTDGAQFGMGAEIGISTQKLHARGPMALPELTSYKWIVRGNGQIRPK